MQTATQHKSASLCVNGLKARAKKLNDCDSLTVCVSADIDQTQTKTGAGTGNKTVWMISDDVRPSG
jgi:hypothetical protein